jgi:hypothetical protein
MDKDHADTQGAQDRKIEENVREVRRCRNGSVHRNDEDTLPESGDILEDFSEV